VPCRLQSKAGHRALPRGANANFDAAFFQLKFGTQTIGANTSVIGSMCVWFNVATSGSVAYTFTGTNGNGPFVTGSFNLPGAPVPD
jgi:hypothetical protein